MLKGRPWTFRLEYTGPNPNNNSGVSRKFWLATGRARHEPVEVHYGTINGGTPVILIKDWDYIEAKAPEKEAKGYVYTDTPFVRVRQSTLNVVAVQATTPRKPSSPTTAPPPVRLPPVVIPGMVSIQAQPVSVSNLPGPWGRIVSVQKQADGTWWGLDAKGGRVLQMTKDGARSLVRDHQHISVVGL